MQTELSHFDIEIRLQEIEKNLLNFIEKRKDDLSGIAARDWFEAFGKKIIAGLRNQQEESCSSH